MLLAIDVGNTNIVFALCEDETIRWRWRISTDALRTADEYAVWLHQLMALEGVDKACITDAIIATVVPPTLHNIQRLCRKYFDTEPLVVDARMDFGLSINLPNPAEVGADRVVNAVAARQSWAGPLVVVDFGTATTFDVVVENAYVGGVIAPGINLSMDALYAAAAKLPRIAVEPPANGLGVIGRGTVHAMQSGVFWGYVGLIEGLLARIAAELGTPVTVIATGGLATLFSSQTRVIDTVDGDLTIKGLMMLHTRNKQRTE